MASRRNYIALDMDIFAEYAERIDELNGNLQEIFTDVMEQAAETVQEDTKAALSSANLPAHGKYSHGETAASVVDNPQVVWSGSIGELGLGFDKSIYGAGGWLITGTPKMQPDYALEKIYVQKTYAKKIVQQMNEHLQDYLDELSGG